MAFELHTFVASPTIGELNSLKKSEIVQVAKHFEIEFTTKMRKDEIKKLVAEYLVDENIVSEGDLEDLNISISSSVECDNSLEIKKARVGCAKRGKRVEIQRNGISTKTKRNGNGGQVKRIGIKCSK